MAEWRWPRPSQALIGLLLVWACVVAGAGVGCGEAAVTDGRAARRAQERHLWVLFEKYGDGNGSLTVGGLSLLLRSMGVDHLHTVTVTHTHPNASATQQRHAHAHAHGKHAAAGSASSAPHSRKQADAARTDAHKSDSSHNLVIDSSEGKKIQSDSQHNLYTKRGQGSTPPPSPPATTPPGRSRRSAEYDLTQDHTPTTQTTPPTTQHDDHDHDHTHQPQGNNSQEVRHTHTHT